MAPPLFTDRLDEAFRLARTLHATQPRKGGDIPYLAHLMGVCSLVLEDGGTEDEAVAALLHDAVEDQGGPETLELIRDQFGDQVAWIVEACSDTDQIPKPPWRERKERYITHIQETDDADVLRVALADKLHNARAILFDQRAGHDVWSRFGADRQGVLWYYRSLADAFAHKTASAMAAELAWIVDQLEAEA